MKYETKDNRLSLKVLLLILIMSVVSSNGFAQCLDSRGVCGASDVIVTTAGDTQDPGYETAYVLVNQATGLVVASNTTGNFTADVTPGNVYQIHILNYDTANPPDPLPTAAGADPTTIGSTTTGCYNDTDFLSEYLCVAVNLEASICEGDALEVTTAGNNVGTGYETVYILVSGGVVVASNMTGIFTADVTAGNSYQIHILNYDTTNPPAPLPANPGDDPATTGTTTPGCYNVNDFLIEYLCVEVTSCGCLAEVAICEGDAVVVTTTAPNMNPGYETVFVLVDTATGTVVASNTTGDFTADVVGGNSYTIHTLNYDTTMPPDPLPINPGDDPTTIGSVTQGCYDAAFLTEVLCVNVSERFEICEGDDLIAITTGANTAAGYETVFVLVDATGVVVASNMTGIFTNDVIGGLGGIANNYTIYTLNYDTADPPDPLPINPGDDPATIGTVTPGCYDADFLSEPLCVSVTRCCYAEAGGPFYSLLCPGDDATGSVTGDYQDPDYETLVFVVDINGTILGIFPSGTPIPYSFWPSTNTSYTIFSFNYDTVDPPVPLPTVGDDISAITGGCFELSQGYSIFVPAPLAVDCDVQTSEGNQGGITPFYYNTHEICISGGTPPYDYWWETSGYVRHAIVGLGEIRIIYDDHATWTVTVTDANGCSDQTWVFTNDPATAGGTGGILDIYADVITAATECYDEDGSVEIFVEGGTSPYMYNWSGPFTWNGTGQGTSVISQAPQGWYSVTVTDSVGDTTEGWYWVHCHFPTGGLGGGRGKLSAEHFRNGLGMIAYPNPFKKETLIEFSITETEHVDITLFSVDGQQLVRLFDGDVQAGQSYTIPFNAGHLPPGIYIVRLNTTSGKMKHEKLILSAKH